MDLGARRWSGSAHGIGPRNRRRLARQTPTTRRKSLQLLRVLRMELAGLEPAASWVRCGKPSGCGRRRVSALKSGICLATSRYGEARIAVDYRGLRSIWAPEAA